MKQDKLEQFIQKNRDDFDDLEPPFGLFDQIEAHLDAVEKPAPKEAPQKAKKVPFYKQKWIGVAAGILLPVMILSVVLSTVRSNGNNHTTEAAGIASYMYSKEYVEMTETELYYKREIEQKEEKLKSLVAYNPLLTEVVDETLTDLSDSYAHLNNDFQMNLNSDEMMDAIVNHQRMRLQTIEDLISQIEMSKMQ